jgi:tetratricopeptide (TPR) repeat protein
LNALGSILCGKGEFDDALALYHESLAMRRKLLGYENEYTAVTRTSLGNCLRKAGRYEEAQAELLEALRVFRIAVGDHHRRTITCLERLVELYDTWSRPDDARKYRDSIKQFRARPASP